MPGRSFGSAVLPAIAASRLCTPTALRPLLRRLATGGADCPLNGSRAGGRADCDGWSRSCRGGSAGNGRLADLAGAVLSRGLRQGRRYGAAAQRDASGAVILGAGLCYIDGFGLRRKRRDGNQKKRKNGRKSPQNLPRQRRPPIGCREDTYCPPASGDASTSASRRMQGTISPTAIS